jgi:WD40 repeat protein
VAFSSDSTLLAIQTQSDTRMVELSTGEELRALPGDTAGERPNRRRVVFSSDGKVMVTTTGSGLVQAWSTESWQPVQQFGAVNEEVDFALSPDGRWLALSVPSGVTLYEVASGKPVQELPPELRPARALSLSGQADVLELLVDGVLHFWHVPSQRLLAVAHLYWQLGAALLVDPNVGRFEIVGDDAKAAEANVRCVAGQLSFPLALCKHRRYQQKLLSSALGHGSGQE